MTAATAPIRHAEPTKATMIEAAIRRRALYAARYAERVEAARRCGGPDR